MDSNIKIINSLKESGNIEFKNGNYEKSLEIFTEALKYENPDMKIALLLNRAETFLRLGYFYSAIIDCNQVLETDSTNIKALYRKARSLACNKAEIVALELYESILKRDLDAETKIQINTKIFNLKRRIKYINGEFIDGLKPLLDEEKELNELIDKKCKSLNEFNFGNYFNTKLIKDYSLDKGIHYKANDNIKEGEVLLIEQPLIHIFSKNYEKNKYNLIDELNLDEEFEDEQSIIYQILLTKLKQKMKYEQLNDLLYSLYNSSNLNEDLKKRKENFSTQDKNLLKIISCNCLLTTKNTHGFEYNDICYGLWIESSFFNHSCTPNAFYFGVGPYIIIKSISNIRKGEEIFISYTEPKPYVERVSSLAKWGFKCKCSLCIDEEVVLNDKKYLLVYSYINKMKDILAKNNVISYKELKTFFFKNSAKVFIDMFNEVHNLNEENMITFIFLKNLFMIMAFSDETEISYKIFLKAYEIIRKFSNRELFEHLSNLEYVISNVNEKLNNSVSVDLTDKVKHLYNILYELN